MLHRRQIVFPSLLLALLLAQQASANSSSSATELLKSDLVRRAEGADEMSSAIITRKGPAVVVLILYLTSTVVHWIHFFRNGRKGYMLSLTIGMLCMSLGFVIRASGGGYAWQFLLTFLSPVAFLAQNYVLLGRLAGALEQEVSKACLIFPAKAIIWCFLLSDLVTFACQTAGTVFVILGGSWMKMGEALSIGGLTLALVSYSIFTVILIVFVRRMRRLHPELYRPSGWSSSDYYRLWSRYPFDGVQPLTNILLLTCIGILIRSIFRLIEQADGFFGYIATHEIYFYIFDAAPLWLCMSLYCLLWPSRVIEGCRRRDEAISMYGGVKVQY